MNAKIHGLSNVRKLRELRGWTQEELAHKCGISSATISAYENGRRSWTRKSVQPIAEALGVFVSDLIGREGAATLNMLELLEELLDRAKEEYDKPDKAELEHILELAKSKLIDSK